MSTVITAPAAILAVVIAESAILAVVTLASAIFVVVIEFAAISAATTVPSEIELADIRDNGMFYLLYGFGYLFLTA